VKHVFTYFIIAEKRIIKTEYGHGNARRDGACHKTAHKRRLFEKIEEKEPGRQGQEYDVENRRPEVREGTAPARKGPEAY
jgi:hypothetical protein